jgi:Protein of unknown function (DUF2892)
MSRNLSNLDRGLRSFLVAPVAIILAVVVGAGSIGGIVLFALAAIVLATGAVGFCPLYALVHLNTWYRLYPRNNSNPLLSGRNEG